MNTVSDNKEDTKVAPEQLAGQQNPKDNIIRLRAYLIALPLIYFSARWIFWGEFSKYTFLTWAAPFANAIFILLIISLLNLPLRSKLRALSLNRLELLAIYVMVSVGSAVMSSDMQGILITLMGHKAFFADDVNNWNALFGNNLPSWLLVSDQNTLIGFYKGNADFLNPQNYLPWLRPIFAWSLFIWALLLMMVCVNVILRKAWVERERLTFPIVALPIAMTEEPEAFFKNKLMWLGFLIAAGITLWNGLGVLYPGFPEVGIRRRYLDFGAGTPFEAASPFTISFYFFAITLGFIMPLDLSFSLTFFYLMFKAQAVAVRISGFSPESGFPFVDSQAFGGYIAIFFAALYGLRNHLKTVWKTATSNEPAAEDADEPMRYRWALIGFGVASLFLLLFSIRAGMSPLVAFFFFGIYLALSVTITRIRAEFGFPVHDMHFMGPGQTMLRMIPVQGFDKQTLSAMSIFYWFNRVYRSHPMPHQLEGMKAAGQSGRAQRSMLKAILVAGFVAVPICFYVFLQGFYELGAATANVNTWGTGYGREAFGGLANQINAQNQGGQELNLGQWFGTAFGFGFATLLAFLRRSIVGFPFHPLAYAVANSWGMSNLWLPIAVGFVCKGVILRMIGLQGYRKAMLFFFGLMLGEFAMGSSWHLISMFTGIPMYQFWP